MNLIERSVNEVENLYQQGAISEQDMTEYLDIWNTNGKHFTHAYFRDGAIRSHDPETYKAFGCPYCN